MANGSVLFCRGFLEDARNSMQNFSNQFELGMQNYTGINFTSYQPRVSKVGSLVTNMLDMQMRYERFFAYPKAIKKISNNYDIVHVSEHGYSHIARNKNIKKIVNVYDLIPWLAYTGRIEGMVYPHRPRILEYSMGFIKYYDHVVVTSDNTKRDLVEFFSVDAEKISTIYPGISERYIKRDFCKRKIREKFGLNFDSKYIMISGQEAYKNHQYSLDAFSILKKQRPFDDLRLVRLGRNYNGWQAMLEKAGLCEYTTRIEYVKESDMADLYRSVDCLLFPSLYEGFGWPPIEAMAVGTPVIISNISTLMETSGKAAAIVNTSDPEMCASEIGKILFNEVYREELILKGVNLAKEYTWDNCFQKTYNIYDRLMKG